MNESASVSRTKHPHSRLTTVAYWSAWVALASLGACSDGTSPPTEPEPLRFSSIAVTTGSTCGATAEGDVYCWGNNNGGLFGTTTLEQCPPSPFTCTTHPLRIQSPVPLTSLTANSTAFGSNACGLDATGVPYCWGVMLVNVDGAYNLGAVPTALPGGISLTSISLGQEHICGVAATHEAYCWGDFEGGKRGDPSIDFDTSYATFQPNVVGGGLEFAEVAAGSLGTCGLTTGGLGYCWGSNYYGALGDPAAPVQQECGLAPSPCAPAPVPVVGDHSFTLISGANGHVCARSVSGELYCWGLDNGNQLGTEAAPELCGDLLCVRQPALVFAPSVTFSSLSAGGYSTCGLDGAGVAYCWGDNASGQIGNGGGGAPVPVPVVGDPPFQSPRDRWRPRLRPVAGG